MFLFLKLYLAHLIADFILQFDCLYALKLKSRLGHLYHVLIHAGISLLMVFPYLNSPRAWVIVLVLFLSAIHFFQDILKYDATAKHPQFMFLFFMLDQFFHILFLGIILLLPVSWEALPTHIPKLDLFYLSNIWTLCAIAFILTTYGGSYTLYNFRKNYFADTRTDHYITHFEMIHGILERTWITAIFLFAPPVFFLAAPLIGILRLFSVILRNKLDFFLSFIYAAAIGLLFRLFI